MAGWEGEDNDAGSLHFALAATLVQRMTDAMRGRREEDAQLPARASFERQRGRVARKNVNSDDLESKFPRLQRSTR